MRSALVLLLVLAGLSGCITETPLPADSAEERTDRVEVEEAQAESRMVARGTATMAIETADGFPVLDGEQRIAGDGLVLRTTADDAIATATWSLRDAGGSLFLDGLADDAISVELPVGVVMITAHAADDVGAVFEMTWTLYGDVIAEFRPIAGFTMASPGAGTDCRPWNPGSVLEPLFTNQYSYRGALSVPDGVTWIEGVVDGNSDILSICLQDGTVIAPRGAATASPLGTPLPAEHYLLFMEASGGGDAWATVVLHFAPDARGDA